MSEEDMRPTVDEIEEMLQQIKIQPRPLLAQHMASMPWTTGATEDNEIAIDRAQLNHRWRLAAVAAGAAVVLGVGLFAVPSVRIFAQELIGLFESAPSDEQSVPISVEIIPSEAERPQGESYSSSELVALVNSETLEEASRRTGFAVLAPSFVPEGFHLVGIYAAEGHPEGAVKYADNAGAPPYLDELVIHQRDTTREMDPFFGQAMAQATMIQGMAFPVSRGLSSVSGAGRSYTMDPEQAVGEGDVGASAQIITVEVAGVDAEYVTGWWVPSSDNPDMNDNGTFDYVTVWDPAYPVQQLRWEINGITYTLQYYDYDLGHGTPVLTMQDLIALAESMFG